MKEVLMIHLKINEAIELSIAKMLRNGVPQQGAEIASPIFLEAELWGSTNTVFAISKPVFWSIEQLPRGAEH
jgi:hypothetical protein